MVLCIYTISTKKEKKKQKEKESTATTVRFLNEALEDYG
jgi:hypothetical protein